MNQYAYVEQVIRLKDLSDVTGKDGHPKKGDRVLLHTDGGFDFGYEKDDETGLIPYDQDQIVYFELSSLPMKEGQTYLYFGNESKLNSCRKTPLYYAGDGMIEYFSLDSQNLSYCDKEASAATYQDFALCDYLVRSEKGAKRIEEVKEMLLDMLSVK